MKPLCPDGLELRPYQREGVEWMAERKAAILADDMGLGKTIQTAGVINLLEPERVLVVCPATLKYQWVREMEKWLVRSMPAQVVEGRKGDLDEGPGITVINYDILHHRRAWLRKREWDVIIADEAHMIRNPAAKRTKAFMKILSERVYFLTGTPVMSRPVEIHTLLRCIAERTGDGRTVLHSRHEFGMRYCGGCRSFGGGYEYKGATNLRELHELISPVMLRRTKTEVLADLPAKIRSVIELPPPKEVRGTVDILNRKFEISRSAIDDLKRRAAFARDGGSVGAYKKIASELRDKVFASFTELSGELRECGLAKVPLASQHVKMVLEENPDAKMVVFVHHHDVYDAVKASLAPLGVLGFDGRTPSARKRQEAVQRFQERGDERVFLAGIRPGGVGITLTRAHFVGFVELSWVPSEITQAEDRCHRIGQPLPVQVFHYVLEGSVDAMIARSIVGKQKTIRTVVDGYRPKERKRAAADGRLALLQPLRMTWSGAAEAERLLRELDSWWNRPGRGPSLPDTDPVRRRARCIDTPQDFDEARHLLYKYRGQFKENDLRNLNLKTV